VQIKLILSNGKEYLKLVSKCKHKGDISNARTRILKKCMQVPHCSIKRIRVGLFSKKKKKKKKIDQKKPQKKKISYLEEIILKKNIRISTQNPNPITSEGRPCERKYIYVYPFQFY
jgi:predicted transglutaminase-like protease